MLFTPEIIEKLRHRLQQPLPGEEAQFRMAPSYRPRLSKEQIAAYNPRISAVLILLYERDGQLTTALTQRHAYQGVHGGQMSFPGGKREEGDPDLIHTALREAEEEIGIKRDELELLGNLSELYIPPSNFLVQPVLAYSAASLQFTLQQQEVEKVVEIPLAYFLDDANVNMQTEIKLFNGTTVHVPAVTYRGHVIWGATAIIISELVWLLKELQ